MVSAPSDFIANAHNELYAFYMKKRDSLNKILRPIWGGYKSAAAPH